MTTDNIATNLDELTMKLERNHRQVLHLIKKLCSYRYEPKNYDCYIKLRDLQKGFKDLASDQMQLFDKIQQHGVNATEAKQLMDEAATRFIVLEKLTAQYILDINGY
ncbi:hypothetical protein FGF1_39650 [Flavobacteriaceae bacterium GF1]